MKSRCLYVCTVLRDERLGAKHIPLISCPACWELMSDRLSVSGAGELYVGLAGGGYDDKHDIRYVRLSAC